MRDFFNINSPIRFVFPIDGDCINNNDGDFVDVCVKAPCDHDILICGIKAENIEGFFHAKIEIKDSDTELVAVDLTDDIETKIRVFRLNSPIGYYRISSDDNIVFLADITANKDKYSSIFENPYLAVYKKAHDLYGAAVHINLFYEFNDESAAVFNNKREYFNLSMMTDKFKDEFEANSDWLKLSFHANAERPDRPYLNATAEQITTDAERVIKEIRRFAGDSVLTPCTTVHWGDTSLEAAIALRQIGYKAMTGYFILNEGPVAYYAPDDLIDHVYTRDFWKDTETDILFGRIDLVLNCHPLEENLDIIRSVMSSPTRGGFVSAMIHEQYFYDDYIAYIPNFEELVLEACKLISENGYKGRHIADVAGFEKNI